MDDFNKEDFLRNIHTIPSWVKTGDDLMKFCKHIQYRMLQSQQIAKWHQKTFQLTDEQHVELNDIAHKYNDAYENDISEFQPFKDIFKP